MSGDLGNDMRQPPVWRVRYRRKNRKRWRYVREVFITIKMAHVERDFFIEDGHGAEIVQYEAWASP